MADQSSSIADANTYSSGDLFAAGIVDNGIGPLVCIGDATGAGGANVWPAEALADALRPTKITLPDFPGGVGFTMSIRRAVRSGPSEGTLIEDGGVAGQSYDITGADIFNHNQDLIEHCAAMLATQPWTRLNVKQTKSGLQVETVGLDQLDIFADGHPAGPPQKIMRDGKNILKLRPKKGQMVEIVGFAHGSVHQRRRLTVA